MRNDARPIGEGEEKSPVPDPQPSADVDRRPSVPHDRQSHLVNRKAKEDASRVDRGADGSDATMPGDDPALNTKL